MNRAKIIIAGFAIFAAVLIGLFAASMLEPDAVPVATAPDAAPQVVQTPQTDVLVATRELKSGKALTEFDMAWMPYPDNLLTPSMILKKNEPDAFKSYIGKIPNQILSAGEPIRPDRMNAPVAGGLLATLLKPGMRAYTVSIDERNANPGFYMPQDIVDLIAFGKWENDGKGAQVIMKGVKIIAVGGKVEITPMSDTKPRTVTLEVSPSEFELLGKIERSGINLVLSPLATEEGKSAFEQRATVPTILFQKRPL